MGVPYPFLSVNIHSRRADFSIKLRNCGAVVLLLCWFQIRCQRCLLDYGYLETMKFMKL